jgi:hypothetical protein
VVGVPGQVIVRSKPAPLDQKPDLEHTMLPDLIGVSLTSLMARVDTLEGQIDDHRNNHHPVTPHEGIWRGEDFSI